MTEPEDCSCELSIQGRIVPKTAMGELVESVGKTDWRHQLDTQGYLLIRGLYDTDQVLEARHAILSHLAHVDEVLEPHQNAIASGRSRRAELHPDLGLFWRSVSETPALRQLIHGPNIKALMDQLFDEPSKPFDFTWLRAMTAGRASPLHIDHPYMNRGTERLLTIWTPLGDIPLVHGPLFILEGSHRWPELRSQFEGHDVDRDPSKPGYIQDHAVDLAARHCARILTTAFELGDALVFSMFTAHASLDNNSKGNLIRLSCDTRFQPRSEPMDERFRGPDPPAHGGKGYGCLSAAQPLMTAPSLR